MPPRKRNSRPAPAPAPTVTTNVGERGRDYEAEKLTGNRAQRGVLGTGQPKYVYEVQWKGAYANTWEPASCLVGWESEMASIDTK